MSSSDRLILPASWPAAEATPLEPPARIQDCGWSAAVEAGGSGWTYTSFVGAVEEITGRPADFFLASPQRWGGIVHAEDRARWDQAFVRLLRERCTQCEYRVIRPDETVRWVHETVQVVGDGDRRMGYCGTITDITDCKHSGIASRLMRALTVAIAEAANVEEALRVGLAEVCSATGWLVGQAWIPSADGKELESSPAYYGAPGLEGYRTQSAALHFAPNEGLVGKVWATRKPWWIRDVTRDTTFVRVGLARQYGLRSAFALPILAGEQVLAVLSFLAREARGEDRHLLELISGVAAQLGGFLLRKQIEQELLRERHLLHVLMDSVPDGIYFKDSASRFVRVNRSVAGRFGLPPEEVAGKCDADFFDNASVEEFVEDERQVIASGTPVIAKEEREVWPDGKVTWAATTTLPMRDAGGRVVGIVGVTRDITMQKRAEEDLRASKESLEKLVEENAALLEKVRRSEEKYRALFEHAIEGIFQTTPAGRYLTANPALAHMHGYDSPEDLKAHVADVSRGLYVDPADREKFVRLMEEQGAVRDFQFRALRKDGQVIWVSENAHAVRDAAGNLLYYEGTSQDITERKRAEEALRASEARYQSLVENLAQAVFLKDTDFRLVAVNKPFCVWVGRSESELLGKTDFELFPEHLAKQYRADDELVARAGQRIDQEEENVRGNDIRTVHVVKSPIRDNLGNTVGVLGSFWDVTEQKRLEAQLRQSQKMDAIGQLAGGIAHDFNNLLTAILGNLGMVLDSLPAADPQRELLEAAEKASNRAAELTHQLLGFSRQTLLQLRPMSLAGCLHEVADILRRTFDPRITFEMRIAPDLWTALVDPSQIVQVLINLSLNARDAMRDGGKLLLETENLVVDAEYARLHLDARPGEFVRLRVQDSGHGIAHDVLPRIFEPFFTTKPPGQGTGLGLAMVFGIVKQHGGWIGCYSEVGHGTCIDVYLPRHATAAVATLPAPEVPEPEGGCETVLLVDDEPLVRTLGEKILSRYGYQVLTAEDGRVALDVYRQHRRAIDLVILDLTMPHLSGRDTAEALQLIDPEVRVLFSSGYSAEQISGEGSHHFVHKPYRPRELARLVRSILGQPRAAEAGQPS